MFDVKLFSKNQMTWLNEVLHYYIHFLNSPGSSLRYEDVSVLRIELMRKDFNGVWTMKIKDINFV